MSDSKASSPANTLISFFALYLTTLFSLDTWAAARASPYRAPGDSTYFRPASTPPAPGSYQAGMHGRGNAGPGSGGGENRGARTVRQVDTRAPLRMGTSSSCGACAM